MKPSFRLDQILSVSVSRPRVNLAAICTSSGTGLGVHVEVKPEQVSVKLGKSVSFTAKKLEVWVE